MPQCKTRSGKTVITLYGAEQKTLRRAGEILRFVKRNAESEDLELSSSMGGEAIEEVLKQLCVETPDADEPANVPAAAK